MDMDFISMLIIGVVGVTLGMFLGKRHVMQGYPVSLKDVNQRRHQQKEVSKEKIMDLVRDLRMVTNDDVQKILDVSDATVTRYFDELEKEGKITQHGGAGKTTFYTAQSVLR